MAASCSSAAVEPPTFAPFPATLPAGFLPYRLEGSWECSPDSKVLRFQLPESVAGLSEVGVPSGVKVRQKIAGHLLDKSYSPISRPAAEGHLDLLVKRYRQMPGGGLGTFLCDMKPGDAVEMKLKAPRNFGGAPYQSNRFDDVLLIGNGTGVAPLLQLAQSIVEDPMEETSVTFVSAHRTEADILLRDWLDRWAALYPSRFRVVHALSQPQHPTDWCGPERHVGRVDFRLLQGCLPRPSPRTLAVVCGTDGFLEVVCGDKVRVPEPGGANVRKLQGPVRGMLAQLGFAEAGAVVARL